MEMGQIPPHGRVPCCNKENLRYNKKQRRIQKMQQKSIFVNWLTDRGEHGSAIYVRRIFT